LNQNKEIYGDREDRRLWSLYWAEDIEKMKRIVDIGFNINKTYPYPMGCKVR